MKYRDLPKEIVINKLISTSFDSPKTNLMVYNWCNKVLPLIQFVENERVKLIQRYGELDKKTDKISVSPNKMQEFFKEFNEVLDMDIEMPKLELTENSFDDDKCQYPLDKALWLTPQEIGYIISLNK